MAENKLADLSMDFAVKILKLTDGLKGHYSLCNQLERSATSIGANICEAKYAHSRADFVARHTPQAQTDYLRREMAAGKALYMLTDGEAKGIVTVHGSLIENLYVLPVAQRRGYGSALLRFAMERCDGTPTLWVLSNNPARALYQRHGFAETGRRKRLNDALYEIEMSR